MKQALCFQRNDLYIWYFVDQGFLLGKNIPQSTANIEINKNRLFSRFSLLENLDYGLISRNFCETDPNYLQAIPYVALRSGDAYFFYTRGEKGEENRLHGKVSMGIGGHIEDSEPSMPQSRKHFTSEIEQIVEESTFRELQEEIGLILPFEDYLKKITPIEISPIHHHSEDAVGNVHLAIFRIMDIETKDITRVEKGVITKGEWMTLDRAKERVKSGSMTFEPWTDTFIKLIETGNSEGHNIFSEKLLHPITLNL